MIDSGDSKPTLLTLDAAATRPRLKVSETEAFWTLLELVGWALERVKGIEAIKNRQQLQ